MRHWLPLLLGLLACPSRQDHSSPSPPATAPRVPSASVSRPVLTPSASPESPAAMASTSVSNAAAVHPHARADAESETLLLGIDAIGVARFAPLADHAGAPNVATADHYHTLVIQVKHGVAQLEGDLPYLAIPVGQGFRFVGGVSFVIDKSEARKGEMGDPAFDEELVEGHAPWHRDMGLWFSSSRDGIASAREQKRKQVHGTELDGTASGQYIVFATSRALCTLTLEEQWTGGATAFSGEQHAHLEGLGQAVSPRLADHVDDAALAKWAREALFDADPASSNPAPAQIDVAAPVAFGWNEQTDLKKDPTICLRHEHGRVLLTGNLTRRSNMERAFVSDVAIGPAPKSLAPSDAPIPSYAHLQAKHPGMVDAVASPSGRTLIVLLEDSFEVYASEQPLKIAHKGAIVMAEWAQGAQAEVWAAMGR